MVFNINLIIIIDNFDCLKIYLIRNDYSNKKIVTISMTRVIVITIADIKSSILILLTKSYELIFKNSSGAYNMALLLATSVYSHRILKIRLLI